MIFSAVSPRSSAAARRGETMPARPPIRRRRPRAGPVRRRPMPRRRARQRTRRSARSAKLVGAASDLTAGGAAGKLPSRGRFGRPSPRICCREDIMQKTVSLTVNGKPVTATVEGRTLLVQLLREQLGLTGTHVGCDTSQCGACLVHVDGEAVKSCTLLAVQADGHSVLTIEGVAEGDKLHPMQEAFRNNHALQCGFCTPGMIMSALDLVKNNPDPSEREIREWLEGNLCRCTGYHNIVLAIREGAAVMRGVTPAAAAD